MPTSFSLLLFSSFLFLSITIRLEQEYHEVVKNPLTLETLAFRLKMGDYYRNKECLLSDITLMVRDVTPNLSLSLLCSLLLSSLLYSSLICSLHFISFSPSLSPPQCCCNVSVPTSITSSLSLLPSHLLNAAVMCLFQLA